MWRKGQKETMRADTQISELRASLLSWYDHHHREMPWRSNPEPWWVWVSEIMLQQTRVESVIGYFTRFMDRFPTPRALAEAELDELMGYWAGLGYYARARNLHAGATQVVNEHGGVVPDDPEAFAALKGVGRYTCAAVQSIAFGHPLAVLDGNVIRVIARLDHIADDPKGAAVNRALWARAEEFLDPQRPGDFNQAMMELGAVICTPRAPKCLLCPLSEMCQVRVEGDPEALPIKAKRKPRPTKTIIAALSRTEDGRVWLGRRPVSGLLGGLWSLPSVIEGGGQTLEMLGLSKGPCVAQIQHGFTHQIWEVSLHESQGKPSGDTFERWQAFTLDELENIGLDGPSLKALRAAGLQLAHRRGAG